MPADTWYSRHPGPYSLCVVSVDNRPGIGLSSRWLPQSVRTGPEVDRLAAAELEAGAESVSIWSDREQCYAMSYTRERPPAATAAVLAAVLEEEPPTPPAPPASRRARRVSAAFILRRKDPITREEVLAALASRRPLVLPPLESFEATRDGAVITLQYQPPGAGGSRADVVRLAERAARNINAKLFTAKEQE